MQYSTHLPKAGQADALDALNYLEDAIAPSINLLTQRAGINKTSIAGTSDAIHTIAMKVRVGRSSQARMDEAAAAQKRGTVVSVPSVAVQSPAHPALVERLREAIASAPRALTGD